MSHYIVPRIDAAASEYRNKVRQMQIKDLGSALRWGLHLSQEEHAELERANPSTLGHPDQHLSQMYWKNFMSSPESKPFRVQDKI